MARVGRNLRFTGRVQGVFFRAWAQQQANELGVGGWIRNCPDNSVEAYVSGEVTAVDRLIERLRDGPPSAAVDHVQIDEAEAESTARFEIRH